MNEQQTRAEIQADLRLSGADTIVYLEGSSDAEFLLALLGNAAVTAKAGGFTSGRAYFKGLGQSGSGSHAVKYRIDLAQASSIANVLGVIDGDGLFLHELVPRFDAPFTGPLFAWKAYCIENLIVKTGWPASWGPTPDWPSELAKYGPYLALNRIGLEVRAILKNLRIAKHLNPVEGKPLLSSGEVVAGLAAGKEQLAGYDIERRFAEELAGFEAAIAQNLDEVHALLNGKWLIRHMAPALTGLKSNECLDGWLAHARSVGGLDEVCRWWDRISEVTEARL